MTQSHEENVEQLFPHFVCRVAGLPTRCLEDLAAVESMASHRVLRELEAELTQLREPLTEALFKAVGGLQDKPLRTALLRLKRDVHNLRPLTAAHLERIQGAVSSKTVSRTLARDLERYDALTRRRGQAQAHFEAGFTAELTRIRRRFQDAVTAEDDFRQGLLLASATLFDEIGRYLKAPAQCPGAKARQVERSLMRYYTRTVVKTTPFSTFCAIVAGRFHSSGEPSSKTPRFVGDPRGKSSSIRLNKVIFTLLVRALKTRPAVRRHLGVELNPTLRQMDGKWSFLTEIDQREVFQHLAPNPALHLLHDVLTRRGQLPLAALVESLRDSVEASEEQLVAYVDRLLEAGFLRFRLGIREQEVDWDRHLCRLLTGMEDDHAQRTVHFLQQYRRQTDAYAAAPVELRRELLRGLSTLTKNHFESLESKGWTPTAGTLYEDASSSASLTLDLGDLSGLLSEYVRLTLPFIWIVGEQVNMRHFFTERYGSDSSDSSIPLLQFYEDYYREHFKDHLEAIREAEEQGDRARSEELHNPFHLDLVARLNGARHGLEERIRELWREAPEAEEIVLERRDLEEAAAGLPDLEEPCRSVSLFVQYVPGLTPDGKERNGERRDGLVLGDYLGGFGKYFSRFLYLLPETVEESLRDANRRLTGDELAEICGEASFNADLHPPLLPEEIAYPTAEGGSAREQIRVSDLAVEPDPRRPLRLRLRHVTTDREVIPVDLGFLSPRLRPPLFQLLSRMTPATAFLLDVPQQPEEHGSPSELGDSESGEDEPVVYRPRVTYRRRLVLARRRWTLPQALFPGRERRESEADYFLRIQRWRDDLALPEEAFVRVSRAKSTSRASSTDKTPAMREHLDKPQYIDFSNPLLVDLFSRMTENLEDFQLILEERLPGRDQLIHGGEDRFATEMVLQVDFPALEQT